MSIKKMNVEMEGKETAGVAFYTSSWLMSALR